MPFHFKQLRLELLILLRIKEESNMTSFIYLLVYDCAVSSVLHKGFLQLWWAGATSHCSAWVSHYGDFSCCRPSALGMRASVAAVFRFSSCGTWALLPHSMWDLPGSEWNPYTLDWQVDSQTLNHQGSPRWLLGILISIWKKRQRSRELQNFSQKFSEFNLRQRKLLHKN